MDRWNRLIDLIYPVGSLYLTLNNDDPSDRLGGSWIKLDTTGRFILSSSSSYPVSEVTVTETGGIATSYSITNKGGEATHTLTVDEIPSHSHNMRYISYNRSSGGNVSVGQMGSWMTSGYTLAGSENVGGGAAHNNMPPYFTAHVWYRYA